METGTEGPGGFFPLEEAFEVEAFWEAFCSLACVLGLRLRARDRFSRLESEVSGSESSDMGLGEVCRLAAERVIGAK